MANEVRVELDAKASPEELQGVKAAFEAAGIEADVEQSPYGIGNGMVWLVAILVGFAAKSFFDGFFGELGTDSARALKRWAQDVRAARTQDYDGIIEVKGSDEKKLQMAPSQMPDEAYEQLFEIDWSERGSGTYMWYEGRWTWFAD